MKAKASGMPLRTSLLSLWLAALAYVAVIGGIIVFRISPAATRLQGQSQEVMEEYRASQRRAQLLDSAKTDIWRLIGVAQSETIPLDTLEPLRLELQAGAEPSREVERLVTGLGGAPEVRRVLSNTVVHEGRLRVALLAAVAALELQDIPLAEQVMHRADSLDRPLSVALASATVYALQGVNAHEGELASTARRARQLVWLWVAGGILVVPLLALFFRRRLYRPLAELDRGMARVAAGDLETRLTEERSDELGRLAGHFNQMTDVLRLRASEEAQRTADETAARTRLILNAALDAVIVMDATGHIREWNPQAEQVFGWSRSDALGRLLSELIIPPEFRAAHQAGLGRFVATGEGPILNRRIETEAVKRNGMRIPVELAIIPIRRGKDTEFSAFIRDITERRASAAAVIASEERYRAAFEQAAVGMAEVSREGRFLRVNPAFAAIVGRTTEEMVGISYEQITHPDDLPADRVVFESLWTGRAPTVIKQKRYLKKDGGVAWVQLASAVVRGTAGQPGYALTVFQDVTAQKRLEADLVQAQKLDAVGRLAGGIAHDFNNLLTGIIGYADLLTHLEGADDQVREDAGAIVATAQRGAALTRNLLTLSRRSPERSERVDLNAVAQEVVELISRTFDRRIAVQLELPPEPPILSGDRSLLTNALLNLALNARDAMPDGGTLRIATGRVPLDPDFCARQAERLQPGVYASLVVQDTGIGMSPETCQRIFEPFFTTKPADRGTGLGLAMVYGTVRAHGGIIEVASALGEGTTFTLLLPSGRSEATSVTPDAGHPIRGVGRLLVVDDEDSVRDVVCRMLEALGYQVTSAENGEDAVALVAAAPDAFDLVILDNNMPRLPGREAARQIRALNPGIPLLLASGYLDAGGSPTLEEEGFSGAIRKPYDMNQLSRAVDRCKRPLRAP